MHHYESASSKVISSFLTAGRSIPGTRMTVKELLARHSLARQSLAPITPDFFTSNPRRFKGKSRAGIGVPQVEHLPDELKQECARTWLLNTVFWERFRFEDLDKVVFAYPARLPRHCTPARAIPSSQRRHAAPRHLSPCITHSPPRPRPFSDFASRHSRASPSTSTSNDIQAQLEDALLPICGFTPTKSGDPDKAWELFLAMIEVEDIVVPPILRPQLLIFATKMVDGAFNMACDSSSTPAEEMSSRAARARKILKAITVARFPSRQELAILENRCKALEGRFEEVNAVLDEYCEGKVAPEGAFPAAPILKISQSMIQAVETLDGPEAAYDWFLSRWETLERYIWSTSPRVISKLGRGVIADLQVTLADVVERIDDLGDFLTKRIRARPDGPWKEVGEHFIDALSALQLPGDALEVLRQMVRLAIPPSIKTKCLLVRALARRNNFESAHELYTQVRKERDSAGEANLRDVWSAGLYLHAARGDIGQATEIFEVLERRGWINNDALTLMLHVTAVKGLVGATTRTFKQFYPRGADGPRVEYGKPTRASYTEVLYAHARAGDMDNVPRWLKMMVDDDITPDDYVYEILIKGFGSTGDIASLSKLLERMNANGIRLNCQGYTTVIAFLARTGDSVEAERTYRQALKLGIKPDIHMLNTLMYAHVQSGHWRGVVDVFGYVKALPGKRYRPTTPMYNTLLKAFVYIGAPFPIVRNLVLELEAMGTRPDAHTFALLIQSACDNKEFDAALGLLGHMDKLVSKTRLDVEVTVYVLTILMGGFLRHGDEARAREMFEEMKARNIIPTAITYSTISYAYAQGKTRETLELAEVFLKQLILEGSEDDELRAGWMSDPGGRTLALDTLYQPLMDIYAKLQRVKDVERLQKELLDHGGRTSLGGLAAHLAAYRNCGDVEAGKKTWSLIYDMASQRSKLGDILSGAESQFKTASDGRREVVSQSNILCVPLSIYIDLLSSTGHHAEVAKVWDELRTNGFTFDSHNWNHLIIALIRAGEPERAFAILERVILPNTSPASSAGKAENGSRSRQPNSPLSIVDGNNEVSLPVQDGSPVEALPWTESPAHRYSRRMEGVNRITKHLESHPTIDINPHEEVANRLETLQLIPFTWNSWRPHPVTLSVLSQALARLASGILIRPIKGDSGAPGESLDETTPISKTAKAVLKRIYSNYHGAVRAVREFEDQENERARRSVQDVQSIRWR